MVAASPSLGIIRLLEVDGLSKSLVFCDPAFRLGGSGYRKIAE